MKTVTARAGSRVPPEARVRATADLAVRKTDSLLAVFAGVRSVLRVSCNVGHSFPVADACTKLVTELCVRYRGLLPRHVWLRAAALFVGLLVPTAAAVGTRGEDAAARPPPAAACTITSALWNSQSTQLGFGAPPQPHCAEQCPKCSVVPHVVAALRQQLEEVAAQARSRSLPCTSPYVKYVINSPACLFCYLEHEDASGRCVHEPLISFVT